MVYERYLPLTPSPQKTFISYHSPKFFDSKIRAEFVTFLCFGFVCLVYTTRESVTQDKNIAKLTNENFVTLKNILR